MKNYIKIQPKVQEYAWGNKNFIPTLLNIASDTNPKAELWMGTHSSAPATLEDGILFSTFLDENPEFLGEKHIAKYGTYLPLLFKVLAIEKPLSIQCHPTVEIAKKGWADEAKYRLENPKSLWNYKDDNRKAEVIYALSPLTAMCGFAPYKEAVINLKQMIPEGYNKYFSAVEGNAEISQNEKISFIFETLYRMDKQQLKSLIKELMNNVVEPLVKDKDFLSKEEIIIRSYEEYPEDPGLFCPLILNVAHLKKGEALFLEPCILHAYVLGNGIELMSASDNVLRGGLTHKKMDVDELIKVMVVKGGNLELAKKHKDTYNRVIVETPTEEFTLAIMENGTFSVKTNSIEILLNTSLDTKLQIEGEAVVFAKGEVLVIASNKSYVLSTTNSVYCAKID
jgi:mannose-6-phosphate isomerase